VVQCCPPRLDPCRGLVKILITALYISATGQELGPPEYAGWHQKMAHSWMCEGEGGTRTGHRRFPPWFLQAERLG